MKSWREWQLVEKNPPTAQCDSHSHTSLLRMRWQPRERVRDAARICQRILGRRQPSFIPIPLAPDAARMRARAHMHRPAGSGHGNSLEPPAPRVHNPPATDSTFPAPLMAAFCDTRSPALPSTAQVPSAPDCFWLFPPHPPQPRPQHLRRDSRRQEAQLLVSPSPPLPL